MIQILTASAVPKSLLIQLRQWLELEWGNIDPFDGNHANVLVPSPVVAVDEQQRLLGGLAFSSFARPKNPAIAVWINAVFIAPNQRSKGIASQLVQSAEIEAKRLGVPELFVLSEYPKLYQKQGWQVVGLDPERRETYLTKPLASAQSNP